MNFYKFLLISVIFLSAPLAHASLVANSTTNTLNKGLVGYWTFDSKDLKNNVADRSGAGNNGNMQGFTSTSSAAVVGKLGQAVKFDGVDDYVNISNTAGLLFETTNTITVSMWVKSNAPSSSGTLFQKGVTADGCGSWDGYVIAVNSSGQLIVHANGGSTDRVYTSVTAPLANKNWHHVVATFKVGGNLTGYVDKTSVVSDFFEDQTMCTSDKPAYIGTVSGGYYNGIIDDVRVYNRVLSAKEISQLYQSGQEKIQAQQTAGDLTKGLVGYWTFDAKDLKNNVADRSGLGNNGNMAGFTSTSSATVVGKLGQAMKFDGVNDNVRRTLFDLSGTDKISLSFWLYRASAWTTTAKVLFELTNNNNSNSTGFGFYTDSPSVGYCTTNFISVILNGDIGYSGKCYNHPSIMKWHHYVAIYDKSQPGNNETNLYIDGVLQTKIADSYTSNNTNNFGNTSFNMMSRAGTSVFNVGVLDDVRIYNRVLSVAEIKKLYQSGQEKIQAQQTTGDLTKGLVGYWTFDSKDLKNNVADRSGAGNNGNMQGFTSTTSAITIGKMGQGLKFDGVAGKYVDMGDIASITNQSAFTVSVWVKLNSTATNQVVAAKMNQLPDGLLLQTWTTNQIIFGFNGNHLVTTANNTLTSGIWQHWVGTFDNSLGTGKHKIYINGVSMSLTNVGVPDTVTSTGGSNQILDIGYSTYLQRPLNGTLDDVRIYNRALSAKEVQELYLMGK